MTTFADRFKEALRARNISKSEFARRIVMSRSNASHWANGRAKNISAELMEKGALELGVNVAWLMRGEGPRSGPLPAVGESPSRYDLERTTEVEGVELTKAAIEVAKAFMALPENMRDDYKRKIETEALKHRSRILDADLGHLAAPQKETINDDKGKKKPSGGTQ